MSIFVVFFISQNPWVVLACCGVRSIVRQEGVKWAGTFLWPRGALKTSNGLIHATHGGVQPLPRLRAHPPHLLYYLF